MTEAERRADEAALEEGEAHVWRVALRASRGSDAALLACLSPEERVRLERQRSRVAAERFALTRLAMRQILGGYTGESAGAVALVVDASGKPSLAGEAGLHFSLSHASEIALIAVARRAVGVDVERVRVPRRLLATARRVLHAETVAVLEQLAGERQQLAFLDAWTQRESHVKAVGGGLFMTPDVLPFTLEQAPDVPQLRRDRLHDEEWTVVRFAPVRDARAALVARGRLERIRYFEWQLNAAETGERT